MATFAPSGRITEDVVIEEISRLRRAWSRANADGDQPLLASLLGEEQCQAIDLFDQIQLASVIRICREHSSLSAAGRALFAASRAQKTSANDADRLRKYLGRFGLDWQAVRRA